MTPVTCFHCGLPAPDRPELRCQLEGAERAFCCPGCMAVASTIVAGGLGSFYRKRDSLSATATGAAPVDFSIYDQPEFQANFVADGGGKRQALLAIDGITCAACAWLIEQRLSRLPGVDHVQVNLAGHRASVGWDATAIRLSDIMRAIVDIGYQPAPWLDQANELRTQRENRDYLQRLGVAGIGMMQVGMYAIGLYAGALQGLSEVMRDFIRFSSMAIATCVVFYSAAPFFRGARRAIANRHLDMDVPVALAIGGAYAASCWSTLTGGHEVYYDSVSMFTFLLLLSRYLELRARHRLGEEAQRISLHHLEYAWLRTADGGYERVPPPRIQSGDTILVKPGERIPADGTVVDGQSDVNEAVISGEHLPIAKGPGDQVSGGSLNGDGSLTVIVGATGAQSTLSTIDRLLEQAQRDKPRAAVMANRIAGWFIAGVLLAAAMVYLFWHRHDPAQAFAITLAVLVVSCPCALSLATPTAITAALAGLRQRGILLRRGQALEQVTTITDAVFDKTGTLTAGEFTLVETRLAPGAGDAETALSIAAALERYSSHPIARAFQQRPGQPEASDVVMVAGRGIEGTVDGVRYRIGNPRFLADWQASATVDDHGDDGDHLPVQLGTRSAPLATFLLRDEIRPGARAALQSLRQAGIRTLMLTGDSSAAATGIARELGFTDWQTGIKPADKLAELQRLQAAGRTVMAMGDGINDVPLLAAADISVAVTNATELTRSSADCVLLQRDLRSLTQFLQAGRRTRRVVRQNLLWALAYNICALPLAAAGMVPPWLAAIGMSTSSLVVVANALRLRRVPGADDAMK